MAGERPEEDWWLYAAEGVVGRLEQLALKDLDRVHCRLGIRSATWISSSSSSRVRSIGFACAYARAYVAVVLEPGWVDMTRRQPGDLGRGRGREDEEKRGRAPLRMSGGGARLLRTGRKTEEGAGVAYRKVDRSGYISPLTHLLA